MDPVSDPVLPSLGVQFWSRSARCTPTTDSRQQTARVEQARRSAPATGAARRVQGRNRRGSAPPRTAGSRPM